MYICTYIAIFILIFISIYQYINIYIFDITPPPRLLLQAVAMGSTSVRVGSSIFGARDYSAKA